MNYSAIVVSSGTPSQNRCPVLTPSEMAPIIQRAKAFETKLTQVGVDEFVKQHKAAREKEIGIFDRAQFCVADRDTAKDTKFGTPQQRYNYLLRKAKKYQSEQAIQGFEAQVEEKYSKEVAALKKTVENLSTQLEESKEKLFYMAGNKGAIIRERTSKWMQDKIIALEKFYKESQDISDHHKEVQEELATGQLP